MEEGKKRVSSPQYYMANTILPRIKIQLKTDTKENWTRINPVLLAGEIGIISDTNEFKIGDGKTPFNSLKPSSISGNAYSASKLETPRNISFNGDIEGSTSFDGSKDVTVNITVNKISGQTTVNNNSSIQDILNWLTTVTAKN